MKKPKGINIKETERLKTGGRIVVVKDSEEIAWLRYHRSWSDRKSFEITLLEVNVFYYNDKKIIEELLLAYFRRKVSKRYTENYKSYISGCEAFYVPSIVRKSIFLK